MTVHSWMNWLWDYLRLHPAINWMDSYSTDTWQHEEWIFFVLNSALHWRKSFHHLSRASWYLRFPLMVGGHKDDMLTRCTWQLFPANFKRRGGGGLLDAAGIWYFSCKASAFPPWIRQWCDVTMPFLYSIWINECCVQRRLSCELLCDFSLTKQLKSSALRKQAALSDVGRHIST